MDLEDRVKRYSDSSFWKFVEDTRDVFSKTMPAAIFGGFVGFALPNYLHMKEHSDYIMTLPTGYPREIASEMLHGCLKVIGSGIGLAGAGFAMRDGRFENVGRGLSFAGTLAAGYGFSHIVMQENGFSEAYCALGIAMTSDVCYISSTRGKLPSNLSMYWSALKESFGFGSKRGREIVAKSHSQNSRSIVDAFSGDDFHLMSEIIKLNFSNSKYENYLSTGLALGLNLMGIPRQGSAEKWINDLNCVGYHSAVGEYDDVKKRLQEFGNDAMQKDLIGLMYSSNLFSEGRCRPSRVKLKPAMRLLGDDPGKMLNDSWNEFICDNLIGEDKRAIYGDHVLVFNDERLEKLFVLKRRVKEEIEFGFLLEDLFWDDKDVVVASELCRYFVDGHEYTLFPRISGEESSKFDDCKILKRRCEITKKIFDLDVDLPERDYADTVYERNSMSFFNNLRSIVKSADFNILISMLSKYVGVDKDYRDKNFLVNTNSFGDRTIGIIDNLAKGKMSSSLVTAKLCCEGGSGEVDSKDVLKSFHGMPWIKYLQGHHAGVVIGALGFFGYDNLNRREEVDIQVKYLNNAIESSEHLGLDIVTSHLLQYGQTL